MPEMFLVGLISPWRVVSFPDPRYSQLQIDYITGNYSTYTGIEKSDQFPDFST